MREYSREDWGISRTEYNLLAQAVEQGIIPAHTVEGRRYELQHGYTTVDELIMSFDYKRRFHSELSHSRDYIDEGEFRRIAEDVLKGSRDVASYEFFNMAVEIRLYSRSRKTRWHTYLDFDDEGKITGKYTYTEGYPGAAQPWVIGNMIKRRIESSLYD